MYYYIKRTFLNLLYSWQCSTLNTNAPWKFILIAYLHLNRDREISLWKSVCSVIQLKWAQRKADVKIHQMRAKHQIFKDKLIAKSIVAFEESTDSIEIGKWSSFIWEMILCFNIEMNQILLWAIRVQEIHFIENRCKSHFNQIVVLTMKKKIIRIIFHVMDFYANKLPQ